MARYAQLNSAGDAVVNVITLKSGQTEWAGLPLVELTSDQAIEPGDLYDGTSFSNRPLTEAEQRAINVVAAAANMADVSGGLPEIKTYLKTKFPEDFPL